MPQVAKKHTPLVKEDMYATHAMQSARMNAPELVLDALGSFSKEQRRRRKAIHRLYYQMPFDTRVTAEGRFVFLLIAFAIMDLGKNIMSAAVCWRPSHRHATRVFIGLEFKDGRAKWTKTYHWNIGTRAWLYGGVDAEWYFCSGTYREHCRLIGLAPEAVQDELHDIGISPWDWRWRDESAHWH